MAAAAQCVLLENKSNVIFLNQLNKNFLKKVLTYMCVVMYVFKRGVCYYIPNSALSLIGYLYM